MNKWKYPTIVLAGVAIWFITTAVFGWKKEAESAVDLMLSSLAVALMFWGIVGDIVSNVTVQKVTNLYPDRVEIGIDKDKS